MRFIYALIAPYVGLWIALSVLTLGSVKGEDLDATVGGFLRKAAADDQNALPKPNRWVPGYWGLPDYAKTPYQCGGDIWFAGFLERLFTPHVRGKRNIHRIVDGMISVTLDPKDENALDVVDLSATQIDILRAMIRMRIQRVEQSNDLGSFLLLLLGAPVAEGAAATWTLFVLGGTLAVAKDKATTDTLEPIKTLLAQMMINVKVYRLTAALQTPGGLSYVRYLFAIKPEGQQLILLRNCVYARH